MLFTNGVNLLPFSKRIDLSRIHEFQISLDGPDEVIRAINHSSAKAAMILDGVEMLLSMGKKVKMAVIWTRALEENLDAFIELIRSQSLNASVNFTVGISSIHEYLRGDGIDTPGTRTKRRGTLVRMPGEGRIYRCKLSDQ